MNNNTREAEGNGAKRCKWMMKSKDYYDCNKTAQFIHHPTCLTYCESHANILINAGHRLIRMKGQPQPASEKVGGHARCRDCGESTNGHVLCIRCNIGRVVHRKARQLNGGDGDE